MYSNFRPQPTFNERLEKALANAKQVDIDSMLSPSKLSSLFKEHV
jgi:hypothetical protein